MKFKTGDIVRCIRGTDCSGVNYFTEGKLYTVNSSRILEGASSEWLSLENDLGVDDGYAAKFFELSKPDWKVLEEILNPISSQKIIESEQIICFDCDDTIVMWNEAIKDVVVEDAYDETLHNLTRHEKHIKLLKDHKSRGFTVILWSAAGYAHAVSVAKALDILPYCDIIMSKPIKFVDDLPASEVLVNRVYLPYKSEEK